MLPHQQRSWIGKAHLVAQTIIPTYFHPGTLHEDDGTVSENVPTPTDTSESTSAEPWVLINGTPATCTQLGLFHLFPSKPPIDLVISGPNYGRNTSTVFSLSSGTIGGAMEAATCSKKAIALSYAFYNRDIDPEAIAATSRHSVKLVQHLAANWGDGVDLYSVNVPLRRDVEERKTLFTSVLENQWCSTRSAFKAVEVREGEGGEEKWESEEEADVEEEIRKQQGIAKGDEGRTTTADVKEGKKAKRGYRWAPKLHEVWQAV